MTGTDNTARKMKTRTKVAAAVAALAIVGGVAGAAAKSFSGGKGFHGSMRGHGIAMFEQVDTDGDGKVTMAEATAFLDDIRNANDSDGNGTIGLQEFEGILLEQARPMIAARFQRLDDNGDGELSDSEIADRVERLMEWADRNDDGAVELKEIRRKRHGRWHHHRGHHDDADKERG